MASLATDLPEWHLAICIIAKRSYLSRQEKDLGLQKKINHEDIRDDPLVSYLVLLCGRQQLDELRECF